MHPQAQNHGPGRLYNAVAGGLTKDKAVTRVSVEVDTSQWSKRKRNIVVKSLRTGVAACGWETAHLVEQLAATVRAQVCSVSAWRTSVPTAEVKPEKLDELLAYTSAWIRLREPPEPNGRNAYSAAYWREKTAYTAGLDFLKELDHDRTPNRIPLNPAMTYSEMRDFIYTYLKTSEGREGEQLSALIGKIERGETITVSFSA